MPFNQPARQDITISSTLPALFLAKVTDVNGEALRNQESWPISLHIQYACRGGKLKAPSWVAGVIIDMITSISLFSYLGLLHQGGSSFPTEYLLEFVPLLFSFLFPTFSPPPPLVVSPATCPTPCFKAVLGMQ